ERGNDSFATTEELECRDRLIVGDADIARAPRVFQVGMLWPDAGIVEPGGNRVSFQHLAELVLEQVSAGAMEDTNRPWAERGGVAAAGYAVASRLDAHEVDVLVEQERIEDAHGVGAAADAGDNRIRQPPGRLEHLTSRLAPDDRLEVAHDHGVRMHTDDRAYDVER